MDFKIIIILILVLIVVVYFLFFRKRSSGSKTPSFLVILPGKTFTSIPTQKYDTADKDWTDDTKAYSHIEILNNGDWSLILQNDGNLIIQKNTLPGYYSFNDAKKLVSTFASDSVDPDANTNSPYTTSFTDKGELVITNNNNIKLYSTQGGSTEDKGYIFYLTDTGILKIYSTVELFNSSTSTEDLGFQLSAPDDPGIRSFINVQINKTFISAPTPKYPFDTNNNYSYSVILKNGNWQLILQNDGVLAIVKSGNDLPSRGVPYNKSILSDNIITWSSNTSQNTASTDAPYTTSFGGDGNLNINNISQKSIFNTDSGPGIYGYTFSLTDSGVLKIYDSNQVLFNSYNTVMGLQLYAPDNSGISSFISISSGQKFTSSKTPSWSTSSTPYQYIPILRNSEYTLILQNDGILFIVPNDTLPDKNKNYPGITQGNYKKKFNQADPDVLINSPYYFTLNTNGQLIINNNKDVSFFTVPVTGGDNTGYTFSLDTYKLKIYNSTSEIYNSGNDKSVILGFM